MAGIAPGALLARHFAGEWGGDTDNARVNEQYLQDGEGMLTEHFRRCAGRAGVGDFAHRVWRGLVYDDLAAGGILEGAEGVRWRCIGW
jgi:hypothetical protein